MNEVSHIVTLSQQVATVKEQFAKVDRTISSMIGELADALDSLNNPTDPLNAKFEIVIEAEFLLTRARSKVIKELATIQEVISSQPSAGIEKLFRDRYNTIISFCSRLNELREDFSCVQRSMYARNFGRV